MSHQKKLNLLGVEFTPLTRAQAVDEAERLFEAGDPAWIAVENVHALNLAYTDPDHRAALNRADMVLNDGSGVRLGARILGARFPEDLHGNVFTPMLLERAARRGWPVFFLGAAPGVADKAAQVLTEKHPGLQVVGTRDGYFKREEEAEIAEKIKASGAKLLMVGMGMPIQEQWLDRNVEATGVRLASTVGAFYDFQAGVVPRAPDWVQRFHVEWVYRLAKEPKRLWRRYVLGNPLFIYRAIKQRLTGRV
jgi:exopolysaccharide biosynthesis WecB/TagA/CpsF family protein